MPRTVMALGRKTHRRLFLFGRYSLALLLPKKWLNYLGAERGTTLQLELDKKRKRIVVRFGKSAELTKPKNTEATSKTIKPDPQNDLEPIPPLEG